MQAIQRPSLAPAAIRWLIVAAMAMSVWTVAFPASAEMGTRPSGFHFHSSMVPHFRPGMMPRMGQGIVPPFGPGIVPPFGGTIVPPLVSGPDGIDHGRLHRFSRFPLARFPFDGGVGGGFFIGPSQDPDDPSAQLAALPKLPPPPPDFQPHVVTLKPSVAKPGDPASVVVMRPGQPDEVVSFGSRAP